MGLLQIPHSDPPVEQSSTDVYGEAPHLDAPALLVQMQDDLARSRLREAFWISLVFHLIVVILLANSTKLIPGWHRVQLRSPMDLMQQKDMTYLELPPDAQKVTQRPRTNIMSDKDRIASSRSPKLDSNELHKILDSNREGPPSRFSPPSRPSSPAPASPPVTAQQQQQPSPQQNPNQQAQNNQSQPAQQRTSETAKLQTPPVGSQKNPFSAALTPGEVIQQAARASAMSRGGGPSVDGDYGLGTGRAGGSTHSQLDILSDTQGVDFGPYLSRVLHTVRLNWYNLIPEVARAPLMKKGKVSIEFAITKTGAIAGMRLVQGSTDVSLDRAAWGGITASNPFAPLPQEFHGEYLALRFHFYYNPEKSDLQ